MHTVEINEEEIAVISGAFQYGAPAALTGDLKRLINLYVLSEPEGLDEFLNEGGTFRVERAARRTIFAANRVHAHSSYYQGERGWGHRKGKPSIMGTITVDTKG